MHGFYDFIFFRKRYSEFVPYRKSCPLESMLENFGQPPASENGVNENVSLQSYCGGMNRVEYVYPPHSNRYVGYT